MPLTQHVLIHIFHEAKLNEEHPRVVERGVEWLAWLKRGDRQKKGHIRVCLNPPPRESIGTNIMKYSGVLSLPHELVLIGCEKRIYSVQLPRKTVYLVGIY